MPLKPREKLSQRRLVYELRISIDRVRNAQSKTAHENAVKEVDLLISDNPASVQSAYVRYNIGVHRAAWLAERLRAKATSLRSTATR